MDIEDIRSLIRSSLKRQIRELATSSKKIPESYKEFHSRIIRHLVSLKVPDTVVEQLEQCAIEGNSHFYSLWNAWQNINAEMSLVESRSLKEMWGDAVDFYLKDVLIDVFVKNDIPHQLSKNLTEGVLIKLKSV